MGKKEKERVRDRGGRVRKIERYKVDIGRIKGRDKGRDRGRYGEQDRG